MDEDGLWDLFFATGLPEAYMALQEEKGESLHPPEERATPAFFFGGKKREKS